MARRVQGTSENIKLNKHLLVKHDFVDSADELSDDSITDSDVEQPQDKNPKKNQKGGKSAAAPGAEMQVKGKVLKK